MRKQTFFVAIVAFLLSLQCALAAPLRNIEIQLTQPDGEIIHCFASGDEFYNYLHDANGFTIVKGEGGYYCYAMHDSRGEVVASSYRVNSVDPAEVGLRPYVKISEKAYQERRQEWMQHFKPLKRPANRELNHGVYNNLVVFIRFAGDNYHSTSFSAVDSMFNASNYESISLHNYYHRTSYNQLDLRSYCYPEPDGETILSYEDIYPKEYYMPYDPVANPMGYQSWETAEREFSLLERAIYYVADQVPDTLDLDYNSDGLVDNVVFVIKGEPGEWASLLWPHRWCIYDRYVPLNGLQVYDFNLQLEQGGYFNVSTLCHEMFHSLGAPDLYHYESGGPDPVGSWDLMCGTTEPPQQTSVYMKYKYGNWIDEIPVIYPDALGTYELESVSWEGGRRNGYMISIGNPNQYFFVEYRDKSNIFERQIPGSGMLIYRIDTRFDGNAGWNGNDNLDEVYLFRPGGDEYNDGNLDHAYFSEESGRTSFNISTDPHPFIHNQPYPVFDWQSQITNISKTGDRMSFDFMPYDGEGSAPGPENFVAHVNSLEHQVELSWNANPNAGYYYVYRDGVTIAEVTDTTFVHPYTEADNGLHIYSVLSVDAGMMHVYSAESKTWVILGNYETISLSLSCDSPYGTKGGELEVSFDHPQMQTQYFTIYEGSLKEARVNVPANTEVTFRWNPGFDPDSEGIHLMAKHLNESGEGILFDLDRPEAGVIATYTAADNGLGVFPPQNVTAVSDGQNVQLNWTMPTENHTFNIYRDGKLCHTAEGYAYLDDKIMRSGTHNYHVESTVGDISSWNPDNLVYATAMNYYCEPPQNLAGTYDGNGHVALTWEAPQFFGHGLMAYDNNQFTEQIGTNSHKWGIKIDPTNLAYFEGRPVTHIEMFDCSEGQYTYSIYNGTLVNDNSLLYTQQHEMEGSHQWVRFPLDEAVSYDATLPLWICVSTSGATQPIPCCEYVGEPNSCMIRSGTLWKPVTSFGQNLSWLLRAYTSPAEGRSFSYNLYWGPEEGGEEQMVLGYEGLTATEATYNTTENMRYNVTALWDDRETDFSNTVYLGPSVGVTENSVDSQECTVFPNPVKSLLTIQGDGVRHVSVYTVLGAMVYDSDVFGDHAVVNMERFPDGLYLVNILTSEGLKVKKVMKR